jgi:hypothetical protein
MVTAPFRRLLRHQKTIKPPTMMAASAPPTHIPTCAPVVSPSEVGPCVGPGKSDAVVVVSHSKIPRPGVVESAIRWLSFEHPSIDARWRWCIQCCKIWHPIILDCCGCTKGDDQKGAVIPLSGTALSCRESSCDNTIPRFDKTRTNECEYGA